MIRGCLKYEEMDRYDWNTLFGHSAFKNQKKFFDDNFSIEEAFTKTHLRMCIHSQNINLRKLFEGMPKNIK